jgi:hypothetical protein
MYFWEESGDYSAFFRNPINAQAVEASFKLMERCMIKYDVDRSKTLQLNELNAFFTDHFKEMFDAGTVASIINAVHPNLAKKVMHPLYYDRAPCLLHSIPHSNKNPKVKGRGKLSADQAHHELDEMREVSAHDTINCTRFMRVSGP